MIDFKKAKRDYKEGRRPMGVYRIRNTVNGKSLLGSSQDVPSMLNRHRAQLDMGLHRNQPLQADWNQQGADAFEFEVLDTLKPGEAPGYDPAEDLKALEELWRDRLNDAPLY